MNEIDTSKVLLLLAGLAIVPFLVALLTSFTKIIIVAGMVRSALGVQNIPPTSVLTGLAMIVTLHIMAPVIVDAWNRVATLSAEERNDPLRVATTVADALIPFWEANTADDLKALMTEIAVPLNSAPLANLEAGVEGKVRDVLRITIPAFVLTELREAFLIAFLIFIPFLVAELVISNILQALGMMMVSPQVIALPVKILIFVLVDGWGMIVRSLILGYQVA